MLQGLSAAGAYEFGDWGYRYEDQLCGASGSDCRSARARGAGGWGSEAGDRGNGLRLRDFGGTWRGRGGGRVGEVADDARGGGHRVEAAVLAGASPCTQVRSPAPLSPACFLCVIVTRCDARLRARDPFGRAQGRLFASLRMTQKRRR